MTIEPKMTTTETSSPPIHAISIRGADWKHEKFNRNSPTANFTRWSKALEIHLSLLGLKFYVFSPLISVPDPTGEPTSYRNWMANNDLACAVVLTALDDSEYEGVDEAKTAAGLYNALKARAEGEGPVRMVALMQEVLKMQCSPNEPLTTTATRICDTVNRIFAIQALDKDLFKCVMLLNSLNSSQYEPIQAQVSRGLADATKTNPYTSDNIRKLLETIQNLSNLKATSAALPTDTALAATTRGRWKSTRPHLPGHNHAAGVKCCTTCASHSRPCAGHESKFCAHPGGAMHKDGFDAARNAARAAADNTAKDKGAKVYTQLTGPKGKIYLVEDGDLGKLQTLNTRSLAVGFAGLVTDDVPTTSVGDDEWAGWMAIVEEEEESEAAKVSIDWKNCTKEINQPNPLTIIPLDQDTETALAATDDHPFFVDSGATIHVSPCKSDFITLQPIEPKPIKGVGGSTISACGVGNILLRTAGGNTLPLRNALYVPKSTVRLISVGRLSVDDNLGSYFDKEGVKITNHATNQAIARGPLLSKKSLYTIDLSGAAAEHVYAVHQEADITTWHRRLGHANYQAILQLARDRKLKGAPTSIPHSLPKCDSCILGKQTRTPVPKTRQEGRRAMQKLDIVWADLMGPVNVRSRSGNHYVLDIVDDYTNMPWSILLKTKNDAFLALKDWEKARESETGLRVKKYRTGFDGELDSDDMKAWLASRGTSREQGAPYTSAHIGRVERMHRTLMGKARTMRVESQCPEYLWDEFYLTAAHLHAKTPTKSLQGKTPYQKWYGRDPDYSYMHEIGCRAFVLVPTHNPKVKPRSIECVLIGYGMNSKTYRCWDKKNNKVYQSYHVKFIESHESSTPNLTEPQQTAGHRQPPSIPTLQDLDESASLTPNESDDDLREFEMEDTASADLVPEHEADNGPALTDARQEENANQQPRRSNRARQPTEKVTAEGERAPTRLDRAMGEVRESERRVKEQRAERRAAQNETMSREQASADEQVPAPTQDLPEIDHDRILAAITQFGDLDPLPMIEEEPRTWEEAKRGLNAAKWEEGYKEELQSLKDMGVYRLIPRSEIPNGHKVRKGRPIFKVKRDEHGNAVRYKVRLVFKGYEQIYGKDYNKTTSPTARMESWRILLHIAATEGWNATQIDVKTAFLYGVLPDEEVQYMEQPAGFEEPGKEEWVCELRKGLYGMKQAGRIWNQTLNERMVSWGFERLACESCIYYRKSPTGTTIAAVHVDDFLSIASSKDENERFKDQMREVWTISDLGTPKHIVGVSVEWDRDNKAVALSQTAFITRVVQQFGQAEAHPLSLPMDPGLKLRRPKRDTQTQEEKEDIAKLPYRLLVGCLLYIAIATRPDIAFAVQQLSQYLDSFDRSHWNAGIQLVRYLKGTKDMKLRLGGTSIVLRGFTDADWASCLDTRRSTSGYAWSLGSGAISWSVRKQKTVATSSCEAEYMSAYESTQECIWLRMLMPIKMAPSVLPS